jgi:tetratricopeptide (TPR) repeat protein
MPWLSTTLPWRSIPTMPTCITIWGLSTFNKHCCLPLRMKALDKGLEAFQRALEINPELYQAYFSLGVIHDLRGQKDEAISYFQKFLEMDDGSDTQATTSAHTYLQQLQQQ